MTRLRALALVLVLAALAAGCGQQQNNRAGTSEELPSNKAGFWTAIGDGWALAIPEGFERRKLTPGERAQGTTVFELEGDTTARASVTPGPRSGSFEADVRAVRAGLRTDKSDWEVLDDRAIFLSTLRDARLIEASAERSDGKRYKRLDLVVEGMKGKRFALSLSASTSVFRRLRLDDSVLAFRIQ